MLLPGPLSPRISVHGYRTRSTCSAWSLYPRLWRPGEYRKPPAFVTGAPRAGIEPTYTRSRISLPRQRGIGDCITLLLYRSALTHVSFVLDGIQNHYLAIMISIIVFRTQHKCMPHRHASCQSSSNFSEQTKPYINCSWPQPIRLVNMRASGRGSPHAPIVLTFSRWLSLGRAPDGIRTRNVQLERLVTVTVLSTGAFC